MNSYVGKEVGTSIYIPIGVDAAYACNGVYMYMCM